MTQEIQSHQFSTPDGIPDGGHTFAPGLSIAWQRGPLGRGENREEPNGCFVETVISAAVGRLDFYQASQFASNYNAVALRHLHLALEALEARTADRERKNIEGTHVVG